MDNTILNDNEKIDSYDNLLRVFFKSSMAGCVSFPLNINAIKYSFAYWV